MDEAWSEIRSWRRQKRAELIARRVALDSTRRRELNVAISAHIEAGFALLAGMTVGFCWPFKGEFDARFAIRNFRSRGAAAALPVVVAKAVPLQFRAWWPGAPMTSGVYDIPVPDGTALVVPDAAIVPMNGFDAQGYRLGYGGGYFDRTLAATLPHAKSGRLKVLAVVGSRRSPVLPGVPTLTEAGYPGTEGDAWAGLFAPGGTPKAVVEKIHTDVTAILRHAEVRERLTALGLDVVGSKPDDFAALIKADTAKWAAVIRANNIKPE